MARIEYQTLVREGACSEQRQYFADKFSPGFTVAEYVEDEERDVNFGTEVTLELCEQFADIFDWTWAAEMLLDVADEYWRFRAANSVAYDEWCNRVEIFDGAYYAATKEAAKARDAACEILRGKHGNEYWNGVAEADRAYSEAVQPARKVRQAARDKELSAYHLAQARAWFACWEAVNAAAKDAADVG